MIAETYDAILSKYIKHEYHNPMMDKHYEKFLSMVEHESDILDVGCGPGQATKRFADAGHNVIGIDISRKMVEYARSKVDCAEFFVQDIEDTDMDKEFDAIWAAFVLIHIPREKHKQILRKFIEMLKPNGVLFLGMIEGQGEKVIPEPYDKKLQTYMVFCSREEIEELMEQTGFGMLEYTTQKDHEIKDFTLSFTYATKP